MLARPLVAPPTVTSLARSRTHGLAPTCPLPGAFLARGARVPSISGCAQTALKLAQIRWGPSPDLTPA